MDRPRGKPEGTGAPVGVRLAHLRGDLLDRSCGGCGTVTARPLVKVFGPHDMEQRGATVALHLIDRHRRSYDVYDVEAAAAREGISVRSGCYCNPVDGEVAHHISRDDMERCFTDPTAAITLMECHRTIADRTGNLPNTIRVSLGLASDFADVHRFMHFVGSYRDLPSA